MCLFLPVSYINIFVTCFPSVVGSSILRCLDNRLFCYTLTTNDDSYPHQSPQLQDLPRSIWATNRWTRLHFPGWPPYSPWDRPDEKSPGSTWGSCKLWGFFCFFLPFFILQITISCQFEAINQLRSKVRYYWSKLSLTTFFFIMLCILSAEFNVFCCLSLIMIMIMMEVSFSLLGQGGGANW